jgi:hypothetical protein
VYNVHVTCKNYAKTIFPSSCNARQKESSVRLQRGLPTKSTACSSCQVTGQLTCAMASQLTCQVTSPWTCRLTCQVARRRQVICLPSLAAHRLPRGSLLLTGLCTQPHCCAEHGTGEMNVCWRQHGERDRKCPWNNEFIHFVLRQGWPLRGRQSRRHWSPAWKDTGIISEGFSWEIIPGKV